MSAVRRILFSCLVLAGAGALAGVSFSLLLTAALSAAAAAWGFRLAALFRRPAAFAALDPQAPDARVLVRALRRCVDEVCERRRGVCLRIIVPENPKRVSFTLTMGRDGDLLVVPAGGRARRLGMPGRWVADHPVPLPLPAGRCAELFFAPGGGDRARVCAGRPARLPLALLTGTFALTLAACLLGAEWLAAVLSGAGLQAAVMKSAKSG